MPYLRQTENKKFQIADFIIRAAFEFSMRVDGKIVEYDYAYTRGIQNIFYAVGRREINIRGTIQEWRNINNSIRADYGKLISILENQVDGNSVVLSLPDMPSYDVIIKSIDISRKGGEEGYTFNISMIENTPVVESKVVNQTQSNVEQEFDSLEKDSEIKYTISRGDTLWAIAQKYLGNGLLWRKLWKYKSVDGVFNKNALGTSDPNLIQPGKTISIPKFI